MGAGIHTRLGTGGRVERPRGAVSDYPSPGIPGGPDCLTADIRFNAGLMLGQRRRRWPNIKPALILSVLPASYTDILHVEMCGCVRIIWTITNRSKITGIYYQNKCQL